MALKFKSKEITGSHGALVYSTVEPLLKFSSFWDLNGQPVIAGRNQGREISCWILLFNQWRTPKKLLEYLDDLSDLVGQHGTIKETGTVTQTLKKCTFIGFAPMPLAGQESPGPLRDDSGTLWPQDDLANAEAQWFIYGMLKWRQAKV